MAPSAVGLVLAAGAGSRYGRPKATVVDAGESWLESTVRALHEGGCAEVHVVLGSDAEEAAQYVRAVPGVRVVVAEGWAEGVAASLRAGLSSLELTGPDVDRAVVMLVDLPDVGAAVVARLVHATAGASTLARAAYGEVPGHPVVLGRQHWSPVAESVHGDRGAGPYLDAHGAGTVDCSDLASGHDVDVPR